MIKYAYLIHLHGYLNLADMWCVGITLLLHSHDTQKLGLKKEAEFLKLYHLMYYLCDSYINGMQKTSKVKLCDVKKQKD